MATEPMKSQSQPLHNFSLPFLRWGQKSHMNINQRYRRPSDSARNSPSPPPPLLATDANRHSSPSELNSDSESENKKLPLGSRTVRNRFAFAACSSQKQQNDVDVDMGREKVIGVCDEVEGEESVAKPWNLRPRKAVAKVAMEIGTTALKNGELQRTSATVPAVNENVPKSLRLRGFVEGQGTERKEKRKFWISLSREEIEEDVYALTGSKPARRPKKRPKTIQKQLDNVFPGLYLVGITADSYRVHDALK